MSTSVNSRIRIQQFQWMPSCTTTISELKESIKGNVSKTTYDLIEHSEISIKNSVTRRTVFVALSYSKARLSCRRRVHLGLHHRVKIIIVSVRVLQNMIKQFSDNNVGWCRYICSRRIIIYYNFSLSITSVVTG